jgi:DNA (cytosine-5)-methyltransferase 1
MMRALDLFSAAAGGWSLGLHRAGFITVAACEIVKWRRILYAENNPHVRLYDDIRDLTAARLVSDLGVLPDIIVGSPPCQDISSANTKGKGIEGERSGLYLEAVRLVGDCRPRWFAFENSANLRTRGADRVLGELEALGYATEPCVVGASDVGANHIRKRSWLIGYDPEQLANTHGLGWNERRRRRRRGNRMRIEVAGATFSASCRAMPAAMRA